MMNPALAGEIARLAAPLYAAMLAPYLAGGREISADALKTLRATAITQALALRLDVYETPDV
jgi:hypothetical protein